LLLFFCVPFVFFLCLASVWEYRQEGFFRARNCKFGNAFKYLQTQRLFFIVSHPGVFAANNTVFITGFRKSSTRSFLLNERKFHYNRFVLPSSCHGWSAGAHPAYSAPWVTRLLSQLITCLSHIQGHTTRVSSGTQDLKTR